MNHGPMARPGGARRAPVVPCFSAALLLSICHPFCASGAFAQEPGTHARPGGGLAVELRAGLAISSALLTDDAVGSGLFIIPDRPPGATAVSGPIRAVPAPAPALTLLLRSPVSHRVDAEGEVEWTPTELRGSTEAEEWTAHDLHIVRVALAARYRAGRSLHFRAGGGLIRYSGAESGLLSAGAELHPVLLAGIGARMPMGRVVLTADLGGQAHRFDTQTIREAGGSDGAVLRATAQVGVAMRERR